MHANPPAWLLCCSCPPTSIIGANEVHGLVHGATGGISSLFDTGGHGAPTETSAYEPTFWLLHCQVGRMGRRLGIDRLMVAGCAWLHDVGWHQHTHRQADHPRLAAVGRTLQHD